MYSGTANINELCILIMGRNYKLIQSVLKKFVVGIFTNLIYFKYLIKIKLLEFVK